MSQTILTIDIGGSEIKSALYLSNGELLRDLPNEVTQVSTDDNHIGRQIVALTQRVQQSQAIDGVAIASAGVIDPEQGSVVYAGPTIPHYIGTPLAGLIEEHCRLACSVENDVNAAALGESWLGAAQGSRSTLCVTIGTGVGGALVLNGALWRGEQFSAGEIGYLPMRDGRSLQQCASTTALLADYHARSGEHIDGKTLFARAADGDDHANAAIARLISAISDGLLPAIYLIAPQTIVIGGGIAAQRAILEPQIRATLSARIQAPRFMPESIRCATLGNRAGMLGALYHFLQTHP